MLRRKRKSARSSRKRSPDTDPCHRVGPGHVRDGQVPACNSGQLRLFPIGFGRSAIGHRNGCRLRLGLPDAFWWRDRAHSSLNLPNDRPKDAGRGKSATERTGGVLAERWQLLKRHPDLGIHVAAEFLQEQPGLRFSLVFLARRQRCARPWAGRPRRCSLRGRWPDAPNAAATDPDRAKLPCLDELCLDWASPWPPL
jgi:hypothetical protein